MKQSVWVAFVGCAILAASAGGTQAQTAPGSGSGAKAAAKDLDDAARLPVVEATLRLIRNKFVDPTRLAPKEMFLGALRQVEKEALPVLVSEGESAAAVLVQVNASRRSFRTDNLHGVWDVAARLREVFAFLHSQLAGDGQFDFRRLEYAACAGLLDRHDAFLVREAQAAGGRDDSAGAGLAVGLYGGTLRLIRVLPASPAGRAGLQEHDRVTKIDGKPVLGMTLEQALEQLRGPLGSRLELSVLRAGPNAWAGEKKFVVVREALATSPIESRALGAGVGYVRIKRFERSVGDRLGQVLSQLREAGALEGLVLDLRDNSGGLLDEAVKVADAFVEDGSLVALRGSEVDEKKLAKNDGTEPRCPLVILSNSVTAAGGEIVASDLKYNERALIVGENSFGMGRIQLVFQVNAGLAAVKLTIAEFQAPAGTPIQGIGVVPDIVLRPVLIDTVETHFFGRASVAGEIDRLHVFPNVAPPPPSPTATLWHETSLLVPAAQIDVGDPAPRSAEVDFALNFATELVTKLPKGERSKQLESIRGFLASRQEREMRSVNTRLRGLGIDWQSRPSTQADSPRANEFDVQAKTDRAQNSGRAGEAMTLVVAVTNRSSMPVYRLRAISKSANEDYDGKELLFGRIDPGRTVTRKVPLGQCWSEAGLAQTPRRGAPQRQCRLSPAGPSREDTVKLTFAAEHAEAPQSTELRLTVISPAQVSSEPSGGRPAPSIDLAPLKLAYRDERVRIEGTGKSVDGLLDVCVFANQRKVFYHPATDAPSTLPFAFDALLEPGINLIRVQVRDRNRGTSTRTVAIRRDSAR